MKLENFNYDLPTNLIAQEPAEPRDSCRLMLVDKKTGEWEHQSFRDILNEIRAGDVLVFNNTKVIPARLYGQRKGTGGKVEMILLSPKGNDNWEVLVKPGKKALPGTEIVFNEHMSCQIVDKTDFGGRIAHFKYNGEFDSILDQIGEMPIPPYIHKKLEDKNKYQTIYAKYKGSAAAPTAGLHFTEELLEEIKNRGAGVYFVTLHVGLGTFRPVSEAKIEDHKMHKEFYTVSQEAADAVNKAKAEGRRIIAVGTTAVRTLEAAGADGQLHAGSSWTNIFIYPGYKFRLVDDLVTNFHLPQSTLLMLVSTLSTREIMLQTYKKAVEEKYRFFSFGDAMFITDLNK